MGAVAGVEWLHGRGVEVSALSGTLSASPLAIREISTAVGLPVLTKQALSEPATALSLLKKCAQCRQYIPVLRFSQFHEARAARRPAPSDATRCVQCRPA